MAYKTELVPALQALIDAKTANKNAIAAKGVTVPDGAKFADFPALIGQIEGSGGGVTLPDATTVTADKLFNGVTAYTQEGVLVTGTALADTASAGIGDVLDGKTFYDHTGALKTGTRPAGVILGEETTATEEDIAEGMTAYDNYGTLMTGTRDMTTFGWRGTREPFYNIGQKFAFTGVNPLSSAYGGTYFQAKINCSECENANATILSIGENIADWEGTHIHIYYTASTKTLRIDLMSGVNYSRAEIVISNNQIFVLKITSDGIFIDGTNILSSVYFTDHGVTFADAFSAVADLACWDTGIQYGENIGYVTYEEVKIYPEPFGYTERVSTAPIYNEMFTRYCTGAASLTYTAKGNTISLATVRLYGTSSKYTKNIAMVRDGSMIQNKCGGMSTISISGNTISISVNAADIETYGNLTAECMICSK